MSQYSETLCAMCSILTLISCDWGYIFQDIGYTIDAKPVKNVNENVTHFWAQAEQKGPENGTNFSPGKLIGGVLWAY